MRVERHLHLLPESLVSEGDALAGGELAVEPGRAVMTDLATEVRRGQDARADMRALAAEVVGAAAFGMSSGTRQ